MACGSHKIIKSPAVLMPFIAERVFDWGPVEITQEWDIKSIKSGMAYCRINSVGCCECSTIFMDLRFGEDEIEKLYENYREQDYNTKRQMYETDYEEKSKTFQSRYPYLDEAEIWIKKHINPKKILDWGGSSGFNSLFKDNEHELYVYDISGVLVEDGIRALNKNSISKKIQFDLITCNQVLEHVVVPLEVLNQIYTKMSSGTWCYFDLPFENVMHGDMLIEQRLKLKRHWHEHINLFTSDGIKKLLHRAKLYLVDLRIVSATNNPNKNLIFQVLCRKN